MNILKKREREEDKMGRREKISKKEAMTKWRSCKDIILRERYHAILLSLDGYNAKEIANILYRDEHTIGNWIKAFNVL